MASKKAQPPKPTVGPTTVLSWLKLKDEDSASPGDKMLMNHMRDIALQNERVMETVDLVLEALARYLPHRLVWHLTVEGHLQGELATEANYNCREVTDGAEASSVFADGTDVRNAIYELQLLFARIDPHNPSILRGPTAPMVPGRNILTTSLNDPPPLATEIPEHLQGSLEVASPFQATEIPEHLKELITIDDTIKPVPLVNPMLAKYRKLLFTEDDDDAQDDNTETAPAEGTGDMDLEDESDGIDDRKDGE